MHVQNIQIYHFFVIAMYRDVICTFWLILFVLFALCGVGSPVCQPGDCVSFCGLPACG